MKRIGKIENEIADLRQQLQNHELYANLKSVEDIRVFMSQHVFAVWDFMSLLKALQQQLTCVDTPWLPSKNPVLARFINEIVFGEESDLNELGEAKSHFEMYLDAMQEVKANSTAIKQFINSLKSQYGVKDAISATKTDKRIIDFVSFSFELIASKQDHLIASAFTFGREDLIPVMFVEILKSTANPQLQYPKLIYYFERHIEVDGEEHGPLSLQMVEELCGNSEQKWQEATEVAKEALRKRIQFWDAINESLKENKTAVIA